MKLDVPFVKLPVRFDVARLQHELSLFSEDQWSAHPNGIDGNSSLRLITVGGGDNDDVGGVMAPTSHLHQSPYLTQVLASFNTVWSRSRLMRLAPKAVVPEHSDLNYHWFHRIRVHIPIITSPEVAFHCGDSQVHMKAGEAWIFDNWRLHRVENGGAISRVHLVADTTGSAEFWKLAANGLSDPNAEPRLIPFQADASADLLLEQNNQASVMHPSEMTELLGDLAGELFHVSGDAEKVARFTALISALGRDWRQIWSLYGDADNGIEHYRRLIEQVRSHARSMSEGLLSMTNNVPAIKVLEARVLQHALGLGRLDSSRRAAAVPMLPTTGAPALEIDVRPRRCENSPRTTGYRLVRI